LGFSSTIQRGRRVEAVVEPEAAVGETQISVERTSLIYRAGERRHTVLQDIDLTVARGAFVSLIGPSGCGKSTLLKLLAGLLAPSSGSVRIAGLAPRTAASRSLIGLVFQDPNLLPWKNALDNVAFLREVADKSLSRGEQRNRAREYLKLVGLEDAAERRPSQLSGGMRQRVAIARALALDPAILLMDEPFGALDAITREEMSYFLLEVWQRTRKTIVLVTHSISEAVFLSSRVHVMGRSPARIVDTLDIALPYPRSQETFEDPAFRRMEARLRALLLESRAGQPS
jgi:NitT/TauT family transport system ATP-binding protein